MNCRCFLSISISISITFLWFPALLFPWFFGVSSTAVQLFGCCRAHRCASASYGCWPIIPCLWSSIFLGFWSIILCLWFQAFSLAFGVWFPCSFMHVPDFMAALAVIFCCLLFQAFSLIQWLLWWLVLCCRCTYQLYSQPMQYSRIYAACLLICAYYIDIIHSFFSQHVTVLVALSVLPPVLLITGFCVVNLLQRNNHRLKLFD